jgi:hypothetical protein
VQEDSLVGNRSIDEVFPSLLDVQVVDLADTFEEAGQCQNQHSQNASPLTTLM